MYVEQYEDNLKLSLAPRVYFRKIIGMVKSQREKIIKYWHLVLKRRGELKEPKNTIDV